MSLLEDIQCEGNGKIAMILWKAKNYFGKFILMSSDEQGQERLTERFKMAKTQWNYWDYNPRKILFKGLFERLEGLI